MKMVVVHPEVSELQRMEEQIKKIYRDCQIRSFTDPMLAYQYTFNQGPIDRLYTLIEMRRLDGYSLARMIRGDNPKLSVYFYSYDIQNKRIAERFGCDAFFLLPKRR